MINVSRSKSTPRPISLGLALVAAVIWGQAAHAATCPRKDALGTSRILSVDAATTPRVGL